MSQNFSAYFCNLRNWASRPPVQITQSNELVASLSNPLVRNPLNAIDYWTGRMSRSFVHISAWQQVVPEDSAVFHRLNVCVAVQKCGAPPKLQLWHVDEHGCYSVSYHLILCNTKNNKQFYRKILMFNINSSSQIMYKFLKINVQVQNNYFTLIN